MAENSRAKARALRIPLNSTVRDRLAQLRSLLVVSAMLLIAVWLWGGFAGKKSTDQRYSPGPVSAVHAHLNCGHCHDDNAPVRDSTFLSHWKTTAESSGLWHRKSDAMCRACHPVAEINGTLAEIPNDPPNHAIERPIPVYPHSSNQVAEKAGSCASCHAEHRGLDILPSEVSDKTCVQCHQDIHSFRLQNDQGIAQRITGFDQDHPAFVSLKSDQGTLKFNHALHMTPGLIRDGDNLKLIRTLDDYPDQKGVLEEYAEAGKPIELQCGFCHQPTDQPGTGPAAFVSTGRLPLSGGRFMSMPNYEQHCQVCHSMDWVPPQDLDFERSLQVEHAASPEQIADALMVCFALETIAPPEIVNQIVGPKLKMLPDVPTRLWNLADAEKTVRDQFELALTQIRSNCLKCHLEPATDEGRSMLEVRLMPGSGTDANRVFNSHWLKKGKFDHSAHRDIGCDSCHETTGGKGELTRLHEDLALDAPMIKDIQSCIQCHQESSRVLAPARPGPTNCISCHTYHGGGNRQ